MNFFAEEKPQDLIKLNFSKDKIGRQTFNYVPRFCEFSSKEQNA